MVILILVTKNVLRNCGKRRIAKRWKTWINLCCIDFLKLYFNKKLQKIGKNFCIDLI